jgi:hypothetical protein
MALVKETLATAIKALTSIDATDSDSHDQMADALATAIDNYIKSGDVVVASGSSAGSYKVV